LQPDAHVVSPDPDDPRRVELCQEQSPTVRTLLVESRWYGELSDRVTVEPVVAAAARFNYSKYSLWPCNTVRELEYKLRLLRRGAGYGVMYFATHGEPGLIHPDEGRVSFDELASVMDRRFRE
jgi:hypothetical protein